MTTETSITRAKMVVVLFMALRFWMEKAKLAKIWEMTKLDGKEK